MIPSGGNNGWSTETVHSTLLHPRNAPRNPEFARSRKTLSSDIWWAAVENINEIAVYNHLGQEEGRVVAVVPSYIDIAFDQNDRFFLSWLEDDDKIKIYWYDPLISNYTITEIAQGTNPCCQLDDYRAIFIPNSDILLVYQRENNVFYRQQRDRYLVEYAVPHNFSAVEIDTCGMATNLRFSIRIKSTDVIILLLGDVPLKIDNTNIGYYSGIVPWQTSSSNTTT